MGEKIKIWEIAHSHMYVVFSGLNYIAITVVLFPSVV